MVRRVLIEPGRMAVSMPGIDVSTATLDQLAFDSGFASIQGAIRGSVFANLATFPDFTKVPQTTTVFFGQTFSTPPFFAFAWSLTDGTWHLGSAIGVPQAIVIPGPPNPFGPTQGVHAEVLTDRFILTNYQLYMFDNPVRWIALT